MKFDEIDLDVTPNEDSFYLIIGLPATKQAKKIVDGGLDSFVYSLLATAVASEIEGQSGQITNLDLKVHRRDVHVGGQQKEAPQFRGMSGCGVWELRHDEDGQLGAWLAGIMIEHDKGLRRLRATRPQLFVEALQVERPEVFK